MQVTYGYSDDYATLKSGELTFYYGYEQTFPETDEWCFTVEKNGIRLMTIPYSEIKKLSNEVELETISDFLMAGIGIYLLLK